MLCRVHLVPIRGGLVELPRLDVVVERGSAAPGEVSRPSLCCPICRSLFVRLGSHRLVRRCAVASRRACPFPGGARSTGDCDRYQPHPLGLRLSHLRGSAVDTSPHLRTEFESEVVTGSRWWQFRYLTLLQRFLRRAQGSLASGTNPTPHTPEPASCRVFFGTERSSVYHTLFFLCVGFVCRGTTKQSARAKLLHAVAG